MTPTDPSTKPESPNGSAVSAAEEPVPAEVCGYPVTAALPSSLSAEPDFLGPSYLAVGPGGRGIVLKPLDRDCLLKNGLHPSIKERLARVRELAMAGVANLYGVEREPAAKPPAPSPAAGPPPAWLIWEHVPGQPLSAYAASPACTQRKLALVGRELVLTVDALHRQGIVHGALRASNVIVDPFGNVQLTHVSPLLYTDPADDVWGVVNALGEVVRARGEEATPLGRTLADVETMLNPADGVAPGGDAVLRILAGRLGGIIEARDPVDPLPADACEPEAALRRRSLIGVAVVLLVGAAAAYVAWRLVRFPDEPLLPWLQSAGGALQ